MKVVLHATAVFNVVNSALAIVTPKTRTSLSPKTSARQQSFPAVSKRRGAELRPSHQVLALNLAAQIPARFLVLETVSWRLRPRA